MQPGCVREPAGYPLEWVPEVPGAQRVIGWGEKAARAKRLLQAQKASVLPLRGRRCDGCGMVELHATAAS